MDVLVENLFQDRDCSQLPIPAFFVKSTAPSNVEDESLEDRDIDRPTIERVVEILYQNSKADTKDLGIVIAIHGYNTGADLAEDGVRKHWYQPLCDHINGDPWIQKRTSKLVFLGYRWPSESLKKKGIRKEARNALPILLSILLYGGIAATAISLIALGITGSAIAAITAVLSTVAFSVVLTTYLLRISLYFRDSYRATMFGVPDLVELIRQLDQGLIERKMRAALSSEVLCQRIASSVPEFQALEQGQRAIVVDAIQRAMRRFPELVLNLNEERFQRFLRRVRFDAPFDIKDEGLLGVTERLLLIQALEYDAAQRYWQNNPIKLSFIGHSMGAQVTAQVIRILSDVFDPRSVGKMGGGHAAKTPSSSLGRVFKLGRLILVSPDIPLLTITSGRTNFLRSALRRFEEAYLFSNEGDLALRIASTAANYFSFPARSRTQGYRLGNLTVSPPHRTRSKSQNTASLYGILNLAEVANSKSHLLQYLEVNVLNKDRNQRLDPVSQDQETKKSGEAVASIQEDKESIADLFTYFDCTEYKDRLDYSNDQAKESYIMILDNQKSPLRLLDYLRLFVAYARNQRDVHGAYFQGPFTKLLMYRLAFVGFQGLLDSLILSQPSSFGIRNSPPDPLQTDLDRVRDTTVPLPEKRQVALNYLSWLCAQKQIQAAVSPERYQIDILGRGREDVREAMLLHKMR